MKLDEEIKALTEELRAAQAGISRLTHERDIAANLAGALGPQLHDKIAECDRLADELKARNPPWLRPAQDADEIAASLRKGSVSMHSGATLFWEENKAGGRSYSSDEIGGGVTVWDTCLVGYATLCEAMAIEFALLAAEHRAARKTVTSADIDAAINEVDRADKRLLEILLRARESILTLEERQAMEAQRDANPDADELRPDYSREDFPAGLSPLRPEGGSND